MGILWDTVPVEEDTGQTLMPEMSEQGCFYCGEKITPPCIVWNGRSAAEAGFRNIFLHPKCALGLSVRLLRDVLEVEEETHGNAVKTD